MHEVLAGGSIQGLLGGGKRAGVILRCPGSPNLLDRSPHTTPRRPVGGLTNLGLPLVFLR